MVAENLTSPREAEGAIRGSLARDEQGTAAHKAVEKITLAVFIEIHSPPRAKEHQRTWP